jgi:argininosuccinate synthase
MAAILKEQLGNWYGMLFHEGQFLDPVRRDFQKRHTKNSKWNGNGNIETVSLYT